MSCVHEFNKTNGRCPLCFPSANYKVYSTIWRNKPLLEILRNGKPWSSPWDSNFRFGIQKAAMILGFAKEIEKFALASNPADVHKSPVCKPSSLDLSSEIYLQSYPYFLRDNGEIVPMPFLRLDLVKNFIPTTHIGFGQLKATALVVLKEEILNWFQSYKSSVRLTNLVTWK